MVKPAPTTSCPLPCRINPVGSQSMRRSQDTGKGSWRTTLWPTSPVLKLKTDLVPCGKPTGNNDNNEVNPTVIRLTMPKRSQQPQDDEKNDHEVPVEEKCASRASCTPASLDLRLPDIKISLASIRPTGKSLEPQGEILVSKCADVSRHADKVVSPLALLKRASLMEELDDFMMNVDSKIMMLPEYFSDEDKELVKEVTEGAHVGCQIGERNIAIFKIGGVEKPTPVHYNRALTRHRESMSEDLYVDVKELAEQGKDGFIARLRLRRLNSGSGMRHNMLWDVAQLSSSDGVAESVNEGEGGVYAVQSRSSGEKLVMFKPAEEERFVREGLFPGEGAIREEAAYELDSRMGGFSGVPATAVARLHLSNIGRSKQGAVQRFMMGSIGSMEGYGMPHSLAQAEAFVPVEQVHRIGLLDVRLFNTDRHPGNILLIGEKTPYTMIPIDHGCILPSWFHLSEARFDWLEYPQTKVPFSPHALNYIDSLTIDMDVMALRRLGIREECVATLKICTMLLQTAAQHGKTLHWIGHFMQRDGCFENPSRLELVVQEACVACGMPFSFVTNEYGEQKGSIPMGILSRRPPQVFFRHVQQLLLDAVQQ